MNRLLLAAVAVAGVLLGAPADAAFMISGGDRGVMRAPANTGLVPVFGATRMSGYQGSSIILNGTGTITYEILGYEAGARNTFGYNGVALFTTPGGHGEAWAAVSGATGILDAGAFAGLVDFYFSTTDNMAASQGGSHMVTNGGTNGAPSVNFFATFGNDGEATTGNSLYLFFDDRGGWPQSDNDHDDLAVRLTFTPTPVPEPATLALLAVGLIGLGIARHRKLI